MKMEDECIVVVVGECLSGEWRRENVDERYSVEQPS